MSPPARAGPRASGCAPAGCKGRHGSPAEPVRPVPGGERLWSGHPSYGCSPLRGPGQDVSAQPENRRPPPSSAIGQRQNLKGLSIMKIDPALALLSAALELLHSVGLSLDQIEKSGRRPELSTETGRTRDDLRHTITAVRARIQEHADLPEWTRWARTGTRGFPALSPRVLPIPRFFPYSGRHGSTFRPRSASQD